jgi:spore maturation protein CgeB
VLSYYTEHDAEREAIAQRDHERVIENHTWDQRITEFTNEIESRFLQENQ